MTKVPVIIYNGEKLDLSQKACEDFIREIDLILKECDDFYELIVSAQLIETIKSQEKYIEIIFPEKLQKDAGKFKLMEMDRILIPLTGKFASSGQVTFFSGIEGYSNTAVLNSKGLTSLSAATSKILL